MVCSFTLSTIQNLKLFLSEIFFPFFLFLIFSIGTLVIFGGYDFKYINEIGKSYIGLKNDIWTYDQINGWNLVNVTNQTNVPDARLHHTAVYDVNKDVMIVVGGSSYLRYQGTRYNFTINIAISCLLCTPVTLLNLNCTYHKIIKFFLFHCYFLLFIY